VVPIKDPTSDMAQFARKGSALLRHMREQREKQRAVKDQMKDDKVSRRKGMAGWGRGAGGRGKRLHQEPPPTRRPALHTHLPRTPAS
jgi:hypothetical protein